MKFPEEVKNKVKGDMSDHNVHIEGQLIIKVQYSRINGQLCKIMGELWRV